MERRPTPKQVLDEIIALVPGFRSAWGHADNLALNEDRTYTMHGVFMEFTHYTRDHFREFPDESRRALFHLVEEWANTDVHSDSGVANAVCTCFLENLAGEGELSANIRPYLGPASKAFFDEWDRN